MTKFRPLVLAVIAVLAARLAIAAILPHSNSARFGFAAVGAISSGAPLLGLWLVLGDGRLSQRAAITAAITWLARWSLLPLGLDDSHEGPWRGFHIVCAQIDTQSLLMAATIGLFLRWAFRVRLQLLDSGQTARPNARRYWQLTIGDLIAFTFVAAVLTFSRDWLFGAIAALVRIPGGFGGAIVIGLNCMALQAAAIGASVILCCLGKKFRGILALAVSISMVVGTFLVHASWLWAAYNGPGMDIHSLYILGEAAAGSFVGAIAITWILRTSSPRTRMTYAIGSGGPNDTLSLSAGDHPQEPNQLK